MPLHLVQLFRTTCLLKAKEKKKHFIVDNTNHPPIFLDLKIKKRRKKEKKERKKERKKKKKKKKKKKE
jgi:P pilus assembly chaperone PapD